MRVLASRTLAGGAVLEVVQEWPGAGLAWRHTIPANPDARPWMSHGRFYQNDGESFDALVERTLTAGVEVWTGRKKFAGVLK